MDVLDKFLNNIAYKFPKGYPDINNPKDKEKLFEMAGIHLLNEVAEDFDNRIKFILDVDEIPTCKEKLDVGVNFNLSGEDEVIWKKLYPIKPLKKDGVTPTAGSGNGEIATYWAYQHNESPMSTQDGRGGEDPDLVIKGIGVEIKAYDSKKITLGKFGKDKESISLLNKVFGTLSLFSEDSIKANTGNFNVSDIISGFKVIEELSTNENLRELPSTQPFFKKIDLLYNLLGLEKNATAEKATVALLKKLLWTKLSKKPNLGNDVGYILNVSPDGKGIYYKISKELVDSIPDEAILSNGVNVKSSEISMDFNKLFR